jgi:dihydrofolate synthase/folylpolyglutamate synthase
VVEGRPLAGVFSILDDKDAASMLAALLPLCEHIVLTRCANPRALPPGTLETLAAKLARTDTVTVAEPRAALEYARELVGTGGAVLATGSIYLIADLVRDAASARASML